MAGPNFINQDVINKILEANRYMWYNLPLDISSQELERLLYYSGRAD